MPTNPPEKILDRHLSKALVQGRINLVTPMLEEIVNHGVAAFSRCSLTAKGKDEHLAILMPYRHLLEMIDGVQVLLAEAAPIPARLQLRSAFEALLTIEYITEKDAIRRAHAYLVADVRDRLAIYRRMDPTSREGRQAHKRIRTDAHVQNMRIPDVPDLGARIQGLERLLREPRWKEADDEFRATQTKIKGRPLWHQLYEGPDNIEALAVHLRRAAQYDILYRQWSKTAHAADAVRRILTKTEKGKPGIRRVRDPSEFDDVASFAATFGLMATRRILSFYRRGEMWAYNRWYMEEIRETYTRLHGGTDPWESLQS